MDLLISERNIPSERNGVISVRRSARHGLGVYVDNHQQSGAHLADVWRKSLWGVPDSHPVKQVLLLGLGGGSVVRVLKKRFPNAHVTAVEWDPAMVETAKSLGMYRAKHAPEIIQGDAYEAVPRLGRKFDLILADLFTGGRTDPRLGSPGMVEALDRALEPDGYLLLNAFDTVSLIPAYEKRLARHATFQFKNDLVALFRHVGQGHEGDPPPEGFVHPMQTADYLAGGWEPGAEHAKMVGKPGCLGMRWHFGPLWIEAYTSDIQPDIDRTAPTRLLIWQPITKLSRPAGWHRSWVQMNPQQHGFADIRGKDEYWKDWTDHAQRHRKKWLKDDRFETVEVPLADFAAAYHKTGKLPMIRRDFINLLARRIRCHGENVHLFVARNKETREIISGLGVVDIPEGSFSMHLVAFIHPKFEKTSVGTGLIDRWFAHCREAGIRFPHFGLVWAPGDPGSWKGYSKFKRQFNLHLLRYPMPLIRIVRRQKS